MINPILYAYAPQVVALLTALILLPFFFTKSFNSKRKP